MEGTRPSLPGGHMRYSNRSVILIALLSISLSACSHRPSDEQIAKDIEQKAASDEDTKGAPVKVDAKQGKVTLTGKVRTTAAQKKLEQIANDEPGNTGVDDQTTVDPDAIASQELAPAMAAAAATPAPRPK